MRSDLRKGKNCMKHLKFKTLILTLVLLLTMCVPVLAKTITSVNGRVSFTTPDTWFYSSVGGDASTQEILTVALNGDTFVSLKQSKFALKFKSFKQCSYAEKTIYRDMFIEQAFNNVRSKGYDIKVNNSEIAESAITIAYHLFKDGRKSYILESYVVKDYYCYSMVVMSTDSTLNEASKVLTTLRIDGMPYTSWFLQ